MPLKYDFINDSVFFPSLCCRLFLMHDSLYFIIFFGTHPSTVCLISGRSVLPLAVGLLRSSLLEAPGRRSQCAGPFSSLSQFQANALNWAIKVPKIEHNPAVLLRNMNYTEYCLFNAILKHNCDSMQMNRSASWLLTKVLPSGVRWQMMERPGPVWLWKLPSLISIMRPIICELMLWLMAATGALKWFLLQERPHSSLLWICLHTATKLECLRVVRQNK